MTKLTLTGFFTCVFIGFSFPVHAVDSLDAEQLFNEAMELRNSGDIINSIQTFETLLNQQPGLNRVRLELAVAYQMLRRYEDARDQLYRVLNDPDTPDNVRLTITAYLAQLGADEKIAKQRTFGSFYISAGIFTDSNVNIAPSDILLTSGSTEIDATGSALLLNYSHRSKASKPLIFDNQPIDFRWNSSLTAYSKMHTGDENDYNLHVLSLKTGPQLLSSNNWSAELNFKLDKIYFDANPYADYLSLNPRFTLIFDKDLSISIENTTVVREFSNASESGLEGISKLYGMNISKIFNSKTIGIDGGVRYHSNGAEDGHLNANGLEVYLSGYLQPWEQGKTYLNLSSRDYEYKNSENNVTGSGSTVIRDETEAKATLGVSHRFTNGSLKAWSLNAQASYTENDSNLIDYNYDRTIIEINMSRSF
ncbi:MAG: hypothetical protein OQK76_12755 [Gammaproteobacteria bacterium]|nr:hypothetical protein [Gammaproteobacteria bacterium]MCW9005285.1 hypothetical protein [Gammaproteobacteria bacterium]